MRRKNALCSYFSGRNTSQEDGWTLARSRCAVKYVMRLAAAAYPGAAPPARDSWGGGNRAARVVKARSVVLVSDLLFCFGNGADGESEGALDLITDAWFTAPTVLAAGGGFNGGNRYRYLWERGVDAPGTSLSLGAMHCAELPYVLGFEDFLWRYNFTDERHIRDYFKNPTDDMIATKEHTMALWHAFARGDKLPFDPVRTARGEPHVVLGNAATFPVSHAPVHSAAGDDLTRRFYCDRDALRAEILDQCPA